MADERTLSDEEIDRILGENLGMPDKEKTKKKIKKKLKKHQKTQKTEKRGLSPQNRQLRQLEIEGH